MRKASDFVEQIQKGNFDCYFETLYGKEISYQKKRYINLLELFINKYGNKNVVITRSPGRINLMGRHIDHRGGGINVMATDKDTVAVASARDDDEVHITNVDKNYGDRRFSISRYSSITSHTDWLEYLDTPEAMKSLESSGGDWGNYVKAAVLRFQFESDAPLCGMDMAFSGEIPAAMGLSSSSSIVVAVAEAVVALNSINIETDKFITLCGEGEWFVGSRGGAGDHAAMKCGEKGKITHLSFKPFVVGDSASIPDDYCVIVANSMQQAKKSEGSKDIFNERVACYEFTLMYLQKHFPQMNLREFRDIAKIRPYSEIYKLLLKLPATVTQDEIKVLLPEYEKRINQIFMTHAFTDVYYLRNVALYGISECARADACLPLLVDGQYEALGEMMKTSHNGDRLKKNFTVSDEDLNRHIKNNQNPAFLYGDYACSTERIDEMCDLLNSVDGVYGSELVGAGLGGCVIALAKKEKADKIIDELNRKYYDKYNLAHSATICMPSPGSGVLY